eukprot:1175793-Prorocentrum_minimum.AAC.6
MDAPHGLRHGDPNLCKGSPRPSSPGRFGVPKIRQGLRTLTPKITFSAPYESFVYAEPPLTHIVCLRNVICEIVMDNPYSKSKVIDGSKIGGHSYSSLNPRKNVTCISGPRDW